LGALHQKLNKDQHENAVVYAQTYFTDASGNMLRTPIGKKVVIKGLHDFIVVDHEDVLMIIPRSEEQAIKELSQKIN
jgi:mannose-1-phosphate guanylyltransferase